MMPPPMAVVTPRNSTPNRSRFRSMAIMAPEMAKATVPTISMRKNAKSTAFICDLSFRKVM